MSGDRVTGTVESFYAQRGFGYIELDDKTGDDDKDKVFAHWKEIQSEARWPALEKGQQVEFSVEKEDGKKNKYKAIHITEVGGDKIGEDTGRKDGELVEGGPFSGKVEFYDPRKGFGFIKVDGEVDGHDLGDKNSVHLVRSEIVTDDEPPYLKDGQEVEFQILKDDKGYSARDVTLPGGDKVVNPRPAGGEKRKRNSGGKKWQNKRWKGNNSGGGWQPTGRGGGGGGRWNNQGGNKWGNQGGDNNNCEVGMCVKKWHIGAIVGKKGTTIRKIGNETGAKLQFGEDDFNHDGEIQRVLAISGDSEQVSDACREVSKIISNASQSLDAKVTFLCPESWCGLLIGKGGETIKKFSQNKGGFVRVDLAKESVQLPGASSVNMCTVFGGKESVGKAISEVVNMLGLISRRVREEQLGTSGGQQQQSDMGGMSGGMGGMQMSSAMQMQMMKMLSNPSTAMMMGGRSGMMGGGGGTAAAMMGGGGGRRQGGWKKKSWGKKW